MPIFDELRQPLLDAFAAGATPNEFVIRSEVLRTEGANLRTQFIRIAKRAGVQAWAKPFQNMATR